MARPLVQIMREWWQERNAPPFLVEADVEADFDFPDGFRPNDHRGLLWACILRPEPPHAGRAKVQSWWQSHAHAQAHSAAFWRVLRVPAGATYHAGELETPDRTWRDSLLSWGGVGWLVGLVGALAALWEHALAIGQAISMIFITPTTLLDMPENPMALAPRLPQPVAITFRNPHSYDMRIQAAISLRAKSDDAKSPAYPQWRVVSVKAGETGTLTWTVTPLEEGRTNLTVLAQGYNAFRSGPQRDLHLPIDVYAVRSLKRAPDGCKAREDDVSCVFVMVFECAEAYDQEMEMGVKVLRRPDISFYPEVALSDPPQIVRGEITPNPDPSPENAVTALRWTIPKTAALSRRWVSFQVISANPLKAADWADIYYQLDIEPPFLYPRHSP